MNNKTNYFQDCTSIEQIKTRYRQLAKQYHPDQNHNTDTNKIMAEINLQYEQFKNMTFTATNHETNKEYTQTFDPFDGYREIINQLINLSGIEIELCGSWLWITGDTKPHKELLKELNFTFSGKKIAWYWKPGEKKYRKKSKRELDLDEIRGLYGSQRYNNSNNKQDQEKTKQAIA